MNKTMMAAKFTTVHAVDAVKAKATYEAEKATLKDAKVRDFFVYPPQNIAPIVFRVK